MGKVKDFLWSGFDLICLRDAENRDKVNLSADSDATIRGRQLQGREEIGLKFRDGCVEMVSVARSKRDLWI